MRPPAARSLLVSTALVTALVLVFVARSVHATAPAAERAAEVEQALTSLKQAGDAAARVKAAEALAALGAPATDALIARLGAARATTDTQRRAVLARFGADVPGENGAFKQPPRPDKKQPPKEKEWLGELAAMNSDAAVADTLETVALLRALAATQEVRAADAIYEFAFADVGVTFRDECGRVLRKMQPYSLATLIRATGDKKRAGGAWARYASYQLDRLDKGRPAYSLAAAPTDSIEVEVLRAIGDVKHPDAVQAVLDRCDSRTAAIRKAARAAWMGYVTGPPPPPAPKKKRKLVGGKLSDKELPDYLTYRELAVIELRTRLAELQNGAEPAKKASAEQLTTLLFDLYDRRRSSVWDANMTAAAELARQEKWEEVAAAYDYILLQDPMYARRAEMATGYVALGKLAKGRQQWEAAIAAFDKALSVDPTGPTAAAAGAELHLARAQVIRAAGGNPDDELARALSADPNHPEAQTAAASAQQAAVRARRSWLLYAGLGSGAAALALLAFALLQRRRG